MTRRIFLAMLLLVALVLAVSFGLAAVVLYNAGTGELLRQAILPMCLVLAAALALSAGLAYGLSKRIVKPLEDLDPNRPQTADTYEELKPLLKKIDGQNRTIRDQLVDINRRQEEFKAFAQNMTEGLLVIDREGEVLNYNGAALRLLDVSPEEGGQNVLGWHTGKHFQKAVREALAGKQNQQLITVYDRTYQLIANPVKRDGQTAGAVFVILDVTEREERDRLRQEFSANVSHELKTPLTSISGYAEIMMNGVAKAADMPRFAASIHEEARRLIRLVEDIIQLSRLDEKDRTDEMQPVDLFELTRDVARRYEQSAREKGVALRVQGEPCEILGVPQILEEMVSNLCDNAVKYNRPAGSVTVSLVRRPEEVLLAVADTGIGIPYEDQERVFERFFRVDKSHSRRIGGTGLGLSIVKHGALFHHAELNLESTPDRGTCVTLRFPRPRADENAGENA